jgi:flagellar biosynthesis/type III secretory pathway chaperone
MNPIEETLGQLNQTLTDLIALQEEEATALAAQNSETLTAMLPRRNEAHRRLASLWMKLAQLAGTDKPTGLVDLRERIFAGNLPSNTWRLLEELVHASDRLNQVNGRLIEEQMRRTQTAMQVLQSTLASRGTYGADGRVSDFLKVNRKIDSA